MESVDMLGVEQLTLEVASDGVGVLRLNRPDRLNAQTVRMFYEYATAARFLRDSELRALILTGAGEQAFCAGFDLDEIDVLFQMGPLEFVRFIEAAASGLREIRKLPFPVLAAIHGPAVGGGLALALAADIRIVAPTAMLSAAFIKVGLSIGELGTSYVLSRLVGPGLAAEIGFTGRPIGAEEAVRIGLANKMVPSDQLLVSALATARMIASRSPGGVKLSKLAIQSNQEIPSFSAALELEIWGRARVTPTDDMREPSPAFG
jgi:enoyl-CoA hydratase/carnithine racemase